MTFDFLLYLVSAVATGAALGFFIGRRTAHDTGRIRDLEAHVEQLGKEREQVLAELEASREAFRLKQEEFDGYRGRVADHFTGTSDLLRDLTNHYRIVYDHLAVGASELSPEGFIGLEETLAASGPAPGEQASPPRVGRGGPEAAGAASGAEGNDARKSPALTSMTRPAVSR